MSQKLKSFLLYAFLFGIVFFLITYFVPAIRANQSLSQIAVKSVISAIVYGLIMIKVDGKRKK